MQNVPYRKMGSVRAGHNQQCILGSLICRPHAGLLWLPSHRAGGGGHADRLTFLMHVQVPGMPANQSLKSQQRGKSGPGSRGPPIRANASSFELLRDGG